MLNIQGQRLLFVDRRFKNWKGQGLHANRSAFTKRLMLFFHFSLESQVRRLEHSFLAGEFSPK